MSPLIPGVQSFFDSFPRVSGDEPAAPRSSRKKIMFSPRERG